MNNPADTNWSQLPFHDRDFSSVAELLLVPGCPPGLFTKQFVEQPYPGNNVPSYGLGLDDTNFATVIVKPTNPNVGRRDFSVAGTLPAEVVFPYLSDNFYYTAASVAPPAGANSNYKTLTTEIGGWTGAGWHKMLEFFEVPSSANGAIDTADRGSNYDWYRADVKPGQINMNLIIDEEVFAGLVDDPRLNESLAAASSTIPFVVSQIDTYGYPAHDSNGNIVGRSPIFTLPSVNLGTNGTVATPFAPNPPGDWGRGYVYRDPNVLNYDTTLATYPSYQQVHGIKAAFSDFLKLRHGGSGYLFGYGAGPTGSGDFVAGPFTLPVQTNPLASERPYRSLSYPDINYTILRPASLPPSPKDSTSNVPSRYIASSPPVPSSAAGDPGDLTGVFQYGNDPNSLAPFVALQPTLAPMNQPLLGGPTPPRAYPYVQDPGVKNPYLPIQFINTRSPQDLADPPSVATGQRHLGPPYAVRPPSTTIPSAPFPPTIPPVPARRLLQIPDVITTATTGDTSNASLMGQYDIATHITVSAAIIAGTTPTDAQLATEYPINKPTITLQLSSLPAAAVAAAASGTSAQSTVAQDPTVNPFLRFPPSLVDQSRAVFLPDNLTPQANTIANNYLGAGPGATVVYPATVPATTDYRQHPLYRTEWLQKVMNLTTVRTHQFAVWITVGFFEVVRPGTTELGIPDVLGQELGLTAGRNVRYRSFFTLDRTKATGFNPYYPGNFRDVVTYRRRIE